jgi:acetamidase/formamidase
MKAIWWTGLLPAVLLTSCTVERTPIQGGSQEIAIDHYVASRPENVSWGWFPINKEPVLTIKTGETVQIDALSQAGASQDEHPVSYLENLGLPADEIHQDVLDFWDSREGRPREGRSSHVITGPIYIEEAMPGDVLEIQILDIATRASWGINSTSPSGGIFSGTYPGAQQGQTPSGMTGSIRHLIRTSKTEAGEVALFSEDIQVPLDPFMGILAVAPAPQPGQPGVTDSGIQGSRPPGNFGGNLDVKDLKKGATLYLPVLQPGGLFYVGDPHGVQGDGEVSGTAIEQSLTGIFKFVLHKDKQINGPRAENATHYIVMGIDLDLDRAAVNATNEAVIFLVEEMGLTPDDAVSLSSIALDLRISEVVDLTQVVSGFIPKNIFNHR